jgi:predicted DNA-binding protein (UPF0251 family)
MSRPVKCRHVQCSPDAVYFKPRAVPLSALEELVLTYDELEAMRLADLEGRYHEDGAARMQISRQTFGNIVKSARRIVADALVNGKAIRIEGGVCSVVKKEIVTCIDCSHSWESKALPDEPPFCPNCNGGNLARSERPKPDADMRRQQP